MTYFTEHQLKELETIFDLKRTNTVPVRDGIATINGKVWWRCEEGPELVSVEEHIRNIRAYPDCYSVNKPVVKLVYVDQPSNDKPAS